MTTTPKIFSWLFRMLALTAITVALLSCGSSSSTPAENGPKGASCKNQSSSASQSGAQNSAGGGAASTGGGTGGSGSGNGSTGAGASGTGTDASGHTGSESGSLQGSGAPDCASKPDFKTNNDGGTGAGK